MFLVSQGRQVKYTVKQGEEDSRDYCRLQKAPFESVGHEVALWS